LDIHLAEHMDEVLRIALAEAKEGDEAGVPVPGAHAQPDTHHPGNPPA
jgi:hypothetical protein